MTNDAIIKTLVFSVPREMVWDFLTKKDKLATWFYPAEADLADGEDFVLVKNNDDGSTSKQCWGTVQEWNPTSQLTYSFSTKFFNGASTTVLWKLEDIKGGTKLTMEHSGISASGGEFIGLLAAFDTGWDRHFASLRFAVSPQ
jgi:uncharacterized protein YndB with AHSA1/START domain